MFYVNPAVACSSGSGSRGFGCAIVIRAKSMCRSKKIKHLDDRLSQHLAIKEGV